MALGASTLLAMVSKIRGFIHKRTSSAKELRKTIIIGGICLLVILGTSAIWTLRQRTEKEKLSRFNDLVSQASSRYDEGTAIIGLNRARAREILIAGQDQVKIALELFPNEEKAKKLSLDIVAKLRETETQASLNFEAVGEFGEPVVALSFDNKNLTAIVKDKIYEVDPATRDKNSTKAPDNITSGIVFDGKVFVISPDKILRVDLTSEKTTEVGANFNYQDIAIFFGNVYLLKEDQIAKITPVENGYAEATNYLNDQVDFGSKARMAIDGSVWVSAAKKVYKFTRGVNENFEISGIVSGLGELGAVYTSASLDNLYVIDTTNSALLVVGKDGVYKRAYQASEFGKASDIIIDDAEEKMYLAVGNQVLEASLK